MNIKINKLTLQNFKGIKFLEINADGENLKIYGDNATGKTTVFDAFTWLLFGKDSLGRSDFDIKTQDENGNAIHNLEHTVECELAIDNSILTLKKVYAEKWTKKRGSAEAEFSGHETKYFINEVPSSKKEYEQRIASFIDESLFKTITNPLYFNEHLKWQDRRAILLSLCADNMDDEDILARSPEFSPLLDELKGRTVSEYSKIIKSKQTAINNELKAIPQRIQEANLAIPEAVEVDEEEKAVIEAEITRLNEEIVLLRNGSGSIDAEAELRGLKEKKARLETAKCDVVELENALASAKHKLDNATYEAETCNQRIRSLDITIKSYEHQADELRKEWYAVSEKQYDGNDICPTCKQKLPEEQIEAAKARFNTERANELELITEKGKVAKSEVERCKSMRLDATENLDVLQNSIGDYKAEIERITASIETAKAEFEEVKAKEIDDLNYRIAEAEKSTINKAEDVQPRIYALQEQIESARAKMAEIDKAIANQAFIDKQKARIVILSADEKRLAQEYAELDKIVYLIDEFTKFKVNMLSDEINKHFKCARFKLFDAQINGGIAECCEVTYKGVSYSDLNNASRINIGLDIINTLCNVNGKSAPIIIDNAESVTEITETDSQTICLIVSADDDALRVEKI